MNLTINKHLEAKTVKYNKYKHKKCKWMTNGILISIRYRDKLYAKLKSTSINDNQYLGYLTNFKTYNRILKNTLSSQDSLLPESISKI